MHENCRVCEHRKVFMGMDTETGLTLCMAEPYEEYDRDDADSEYGILTWLDVSEFDSGECTMFKKAN